MRHILNIQNLKINTFGVKRHTILEIPHFDSQAKREILVSGPSGAGKTTFIYALAGLFLTLDGKVSWNSRNIYNMLPHVRDEWNDKNIGMIYQSHQHNDGLCVLDNILMPTGFESVLCPEHLLLKAEQLADLFGISIHKTIDKLSMADQQYVALARALINDAPIIIADEPTTGLKHEDAETLMFQLRDICRRENKTLVVASRDNMVIEQLSAHQITLSQGKIIDTFDDDFTNSKLLGNKSTVNA